MDTLTRQHPITWTGFYFIYFPFLFFLFIFFFFFFFSFIALYRLHCCWNVYKHNIRIFNGREVRIENSVTKVTNCLASPGLPSDAEQLSRVTEFSIRTEQPLQILFLVYSSFDNAFRLEYVLYCQFYAKITTLSIKKSSVRHLSYTLMSKRLKETIVKMTSRRQTDVRTVILMSCTRVVLHPLM